MNPFKQPFQSFAELYEKYAHDPSTQLLQPKYFDAGRKLYEATSDAYFEDRLRFTEYRDIRNGNSWAFVHPSTKTKGEWRFTMFDDRGFKGHEDNFVTEFDAFYGMLDWGYRIYDPGTLEKAMNGKAWPKGGVLPKLGSFEPQPEHFFGGQAGGTVTVPGFHTATNIETTFPYAQQKVTVPDDIEDLGDGLTDYPVIVELDMEGLIPLPDYDAIDTRGTIEDILGSLPHEMRETSWRKSKSAFDALCNLAEYDGDYDKYIPDSGAEGTSAGGLFYLTMLHPGVVAGSMREVLEQYPDPDKILLLWLEHGIPDSALIDIQGQRRYTVPVSSDRIIAVYYMTPYIHSVLPMYWDDEGESAVEVKEYAEEAEALGYLALTDDNLYEFSNPTHPDEVWRKDKIASPEFHGTSYCNLEKAAPEIMPYLPTPPKPFVQQRSCRR